MGSCFSCCADGVHFEGEFRLWTLPAARADWVFLKQLFFQILFTYHRVSWTKTYNSMAFSNLVELCCLILDILVSPRRNPACVSSHPTSTTPPRPWPPCLPCGSAGSVYGNFT